MKKKIRYILILLFGICILLGGYLLYVITQNNKFETNIEEIEKDNKEKFKLIQTTNDKNTEVNINVIVNSNNFDYVLNPDETKSNSNYYSYKVKENGTYTFTVFNKDGSSKVSEIIVDSIIDKTDDDEKKEEIEIENEDKKEEEIDKETEVKEEVKVEEPKVEQPKVNNIVVGTSLNISGTDLKNCLSKSSDYLLYLEVGKPYTINSTIEPSNTTDTSVSISSNSNIISISGNTITATSVGNSLITVKSNSNNSLVKTIRVLSVPNSVTNATTYSSKKVLGTVTKKDFSIKYEVPVDSSIYITQSMAITPNYIVFNQMSRNAEKGRIRIINKTTHKLVRNIKLGKDYGHCNSATYNPNTKMVYISKYGEEYKQKGLYCLSVNDNDIGASNEVKCSYLDNYQVGRFVYDSKLNIYIHDMSEYLNIYDSDFNKIDQYHNKKIRNTNQGFLSYNGVLYMPNSTNYMDMYRITDMKYLGSYNFDFHEIEDIEVWNEQSGEFALLFYLTGTKKDQFGTTKKIKMFK